MTQKFEEKTTGGDVEAVTAMLASWRARLHTGLARNSTPFVQFPDELLSPAVLWSGSREWVRAFRASGLEPGDRIVSALPMGSAFLQLLVASLWEGMSLVLSSAEADATAALERMREVGGRIVIHAQDRSREHVLVPVTGGWPDAGAMPVAPLDDALGRDRFPQLHVDGVQDGGVSYGQLLQQLAHDRLFRALQRGRVVTLCDWEGVPGLVRGVIMPMLAVNELFVGPSGADDVDALQNILVQEQITHALVDASTPDDARACVVNQGIPVFDISESLA